MTSVRSFPYPRNAMHHARFNLSGYSLSLIYISDPYTRNARLTPLNKIGTPPSVLIWLVMCYLLSHLLISSSFTCTTKDDC